LRGILFENPVVANHRRQSGSQNGNVSLEGLRGPGVKPCSSAAKEGGKRRSTFQGPNKFKPPKTQTHNQKTKKSLHTFKKMKYKQKQNAKITETQEGETYYCGAF